MGPPQPDVFIRIRLKPCTVSINIVVLSGTPAVKRFSGSITVKWRATVARFLDCESNKKPTFGIDPKVGFFYAADAA